jgi:hypothetical protein
MNKSDSIKEICTALNKFQMEVSNPKNTEANLFFKSKYAPLDVVINTVKPTLTKNGLSVFQNVSGDGEKINVTTMITHISGEWIESDILTLSNQDNKGVSMAQAAGISITYARRYQLSAMLGISSEDDTDGNNNYQQNNNKETIPVDLKPKSNVPNQNTSTDAKPQCSSCKKEITIAEHDFSTSKYKKPLCRTCQKAVS